MIKAGIIGGAGYTAGELARILVNHPEAEIDFVFSTSQVGKKLYETHQDLLGDTDIAFTGEINPEVDVVFLCLGHGNSRKFLAENNFSEATKIIDLSNDFRLEPDNQDFVYGLPEFWKNEVKTAKKIANPGCFATAISLAVLPLAKAGKLLEEVHINAVTGATGAGVSPSATTHFSWRDNNYSIYKAFSHQHLGEIGQSIQKLQGSEAREINFLPNRGNFSRGIHASFYTHFEDSLDEALAIFQKAYEDEPFTHVTQQNVHLKQVVNTNKCVIQVEKKDDKILVTSVIDNLLKGASGQAVQNMNLMFDLEETTGLKLKASYF